MLRNNGQSTTYSLRYVVLRHDGIELPHFDFLFETAPGSGLASVRLSSWPVEAGTTMVAAADHRPEYLDYEGAVSGKRGQVTRVAAGQLRLSDDASSTTLWSVELENDLALTLPRHSGNQSAK